MLFRALVFLSLSLSVYSARADFENCVAQEAALRNPPTRSIQIGRDFSIEIAENQVALSVGFRAEVASVSAASGRFAYVALQFQLNGTTYTTNINDYIYFLDRFGKVVGQGRIRTRFGIESLENARTTSEVMAIVGKSTSVVVIRSN